MGQRGEPVSCARANVQLAFGWNDVRSLFAYLAAQPDVTAVVWFSFLKETDWRLDSSASSADAVREALAARRTTG